MHTKQYSRTLAEIKADPTPVSYHKDRYPDFIKLTLAERTKLKEEILTKFSSITAFVAALNTLDSKINYSKVHRVLSGAQRVSQTDLEAMRWVLQQP